MKRTLASVLIVLLASLAPLMAGSARVQEATVTSPIARTSIAKIKIGAMVFSTAPPSVWVGVIYQDSTNAVIPNDSLPPTLAPSFTVPSAAGSPCTFATTIAGFAGAMNNIRATETGAEARKQQFRILGYLSDQGCFTGVTLVP